MGTISPKLHHASQADAAKKLYVASRTPSKDASDWNEALREARQLIADALRASSYLTNIADALMANGIHMLVFRNLLSPPVSQDQFALMCPTWRKTTERPPKIGGKKKPMPKSEADCVAAEFTARRSRSLTTWLDAGRPPLARELRRLFWAVGPLIANQQLGTLQRGKAAAAQENAVLQLLHAKGWTRQTGSLLDKRAALPLKHYMYKTRYATSTTTPQEVDIALGLKDTIVLAMECKVSNDQTNSIKRVNDVLKKATAWKDHWGSFVKTAALLQGVIAAKDVERLLDAGVEVFWSHDLPAFEMWLDAQV